MAKTLTGLNPSREQRYQERVQRSLARGVEPKIAREIRRAMRAMAAAKNSYAFSTAVRVHQNALKKILTAHYVNTFEAVGFRILKSAQKMDVPGTPGFLRAMREWISSVGVTLVTEIAGTTSNQARSIIRKAERDALAEGLGEIETAKLIRSQIAARGGSLSKSRSATIARTETHGAANASVQAAAQETGIPMLKQWVASGGERTRDDHRRANGQRVGMNEDFIVGGRRMAHPGDSRGGAEQVINCRCSVVHVVDTRR